MLKIKAPQTVYFQGNDHAVLLLHSFTGTTRDMKLIGDALAEADFSYMIPAYPGHGQPIETFIQHSIMDWWKVVEEAYLQLLAQGFQKISVIVVSLGGLFTLKLAEQFNFHQAIIMSTPMHKEAVNLEERLKHYAENTQKIFSENELSENNINNLIKNYYGTPLFIQMIDEIMTHLSDIQIPISILYGGRDDIFYQESAEFIYRNVHSNKDILEFSEAGHLMPRGRAQEEVIRYIVGQLT